MNELLMEGVTHTLRELNLEVPPSPIISSESDIALPLYNDLRRTNDVGKIPLGLHVINSSALSRKQSCGFIAMAIPL
jgi:hypothetical protein